MSQPYKGNVKNNFMQNLGPLNIIVVEDDQVQRNMLGEFLTSLNHVVILAKNGREALRELSNNKAIHLVITDINMPEMDGISLIEESRKQGFTNDFIVITAHGTLDSAVRAFKMGAFDYITKPIEFEEIQHRIEQFEKVRRLTDKNTKLEMQNKMLRGIHWPISKSEKMKDLLKKVEKISGTDATVLITGETGTGKEVTAQYIHQLSERRESPFVAINCGAIPENLVESELFGHEKGAFTGADSTHRGLFEQADGGTLFLDEIGEMSSHVQPKLLRALETRKIRRIGVSCDIDVKIRLIAATNKSLSEMVDLGSFRSDLLFRLNLVEINLPPLRERMEDMEDLVKRFIEKAELNFNLQVKEVEESYFAALKAYSFPGNLRELSNLVERSIIFMEKSKLSAKDLPFNPHEDHHGPMDSPQMSNSSSGLGLNISRPLNEKLAEVESFVLSESIRKHKGNYEEVMRELRLSKSTLYTKVSKYGIKFLEEKNETK